MRKITVTEDNFEKVLEKLRKMCDKYKMLEFYRALSEDLTEVKCKTNSMGLRSELDKEWRDKNGEYKYKVKKKFFMYSKMKSLIHLDLSASCALVISEGDKVQFFPFGGFIIWTDDDYTRFDNSLTIYKHIYIPDFIKGKIKNLEQEKETREKEWKWEEEEDAAWWDEQYEKDMEREMNEYM